MKLSLNKYLYFPRQWVSRALAQFALIVVDISLAH